MIGRICDWIWLYCFFIRFYQGLVYFFSWFIVVGWYNCINYFVRFGCIFNLIQGWILCVLDFVFFFWVVVEVYKLFFFNWWVIVFFVICSFLCICLVFELFFCFEVCIFEVFFVSGKLVYFWLVSIFCFEQQVGR